MQSLEVKSSGERVLIELRVFDGVDKADRALIEEMSLTRAIGFRGELDDAILQVQGARTAKMLERQKQLREQIAELQKDLLDLTPPGAITGVTISGLAPPVVTVKQPEPAPRPAHQPRQRSLQASDEIVY
jgi:hypothetical protein